MKCFIYLLIVLFALLSGCQSNGYNIKQRRFFIFNSSYDISSTIQISSFVQYNMVDKGGLNNYSEIVLNDDSLFNIFCRSIYKTELPINISDKSTNLKTPEFIENPLLKFKKIDIDKIINAASNKPNELTLIPIIRLMFTKHRNITTSGADKSPHYICFLNIAVFVVKNEKIIYFKNMFHSESVDSEYHPYKFEDFKIPIPQEHWDGLVKEVMREYLERMK